MRKKPEKSETLRFPKPQRLVGEVMFDLDGTLAEHSWPSNAIGKPIDKTVELVRHYVKTGYVCSIFTSRPADHRTEIWAWLSANELDTLFYRVITDKPVFGLLVDDRSYNPPWLSE